MTLSSSSSSSSSQIAQHKCRSPDLTDNFFFAIYLLYPTFSLSFSLQPFPAYYSHLLYKHTVNPSLPAKMATGTGPPTGTLKLMTPFQIAPDPPTPKPIPDLLHPDKSPAERAAERFSLPGKRAIGRLNFCLFEIFWRRSRRSRSRSRMMTMMKPITLPPAFTHIPYYT